MPSVTEAEKLALRLDPLYPNTYHATMLERLADINAELQQRQQVEADDLNLLAETKLKLAEAKAAYEGIVASARGADGKALYSNEFSRDAAVKAYLADDPGHGDATLKQLGIEYALRSHTVRINFLLRSREDLRVLLAYATQILVGKQ